MSTGQRSTESTDDLLRRAVRELVDAFNRSSASQPPPEEKRTFRDRFFGDRSKSASQEVRVVADEPRTRDEARRRFESLLKCPGVTTGEERDLVQRLCREQQHPAAVSVALRWISERAPRDWEHKMEAYEVTRLLAVAAAVAVVALVAIARRKGAAPFQGGELAASADFKALLRVKSQGGEAAAHARAVIDAEASPWTFKLDGGLSTLEPTERRVLLKSLSALDVGVVRWVPSPGSRYDEEAMRSERSRDDASVWVVERSIEDAEGYKRNDAVLLAASVSVCTADWWCLAHANPENPLARAIRDDPERYTGLEPEYVFGWTVLQGFRVVEDLRRDFDEKTLREWAEGYRTSLVGWYPHRDDRRLVEHGVAGARFDPSVMKAVGESPVADARVVRIEERDGIPQRGLGSLGAPPLLYAIVRVEEV